MFENANQIIKSTTFTNRQEEKILANT